MADLTWTGVAVLLVVAFAAGVLLGNFHRLDRRSR